MKIAVLLAMALLPTLAIAQAPGMMGRAEVENYMQVMQEMQACMEKVDRAEMAAFEKRSEEFDAEIDRLCAEGKRDEAQKKAMAYGKELADNPAVQQMKKCSEKAVSMMPKGEQSFMEDFDFTSHHVCDEFEEE